MLIAEKMGLQSRFGGGSNSRRAEAENGKKPESAGEIQQTSHIENLCKILLAKTYDRRKGAF
jgi:hypothetical protein